MEARDLHGILCSVCPPYYIHRNKATILVPKGRPRAACVPSRPFLIACWNDVRMLLALHGVLSLARYHRGMLQQGFRTAAG